MLDEARYRITRRVKQMFSYLSNDTEKVFGIGLSRTGTTSLFKALQMLGYRVFHWRFPPQNRLLTLEDAYSCDGITDITASYIFETLHYTFPKAKFIYTVRPIESWVKSIAQHYAAETPKGLAWRLKRTPVTDNPTGKAAELHSAQFHAIHHCLYTNHETWVDAYASHDTRVRSFFQGNTVSLLEFDLFERKDGWERICNFLQKPKPKDSFPHIAWRAGDPSGKLEA